MLLAIVVLLFLLLLNGIFAMAELAMMTSRASRLQADASRGSRSAATALDLRRDPTRFLSTVQVGITLVGIFAGAIGERAMTQPIQDLLIRLGLPEAYADKAALALVVLVITYFSLVLGELVPKRLAMAYPEAIASAIARPLAILSKLAAWPVRLLTATTHLILRAIRVKQRTDDDVSAEDVQAIVARAASTGVFTPQEHTILQRVLRVGDLTVRDLMVPRTEVVWLPETTTVEELKIHVGTSPYSHFPIAKDSLDDLVGVVHIKDLISYGLLGGLNFTVNRVARKPVFVPETMPALKALDHFRTTRSHIVFVVDEHGGTLGLVTLNDVTTALVGDITRRGEQAPPGAKRRQDGSWLIDGRMPLHELVGTLSITDAQQDELPDVSTAAGLVLAVLGRIPHAGEWTDWHGWRIEVVDMDGARVDKLLAYRAPEPPPEPEAP
ncbi:MAG TPA: hemolysin family protein [Phycisphaerales bacterium]|nr:hemolysin family protein [Phycisphaerales bacterium]